MFLSDQGYFDWYNFQASDEEKALVDKVYEFEDYFEDMTFKEGTSTYELIQCQSKSADQDEWIDDEAPLPEELAYFSPSFFRYKVEAIEGELGHFDQQNSILCVNPNSMNRDSVILHEMIHLHEYVINELPFYFHDMLYWALYKDLKTKIPKLDEIITGHAHVLVGSELYNRGGLHDILFLLKSFDLDMHKGYPLGTVFAYGRADDFKDYDYIKE